eukprot:Gb_36078 [translate_table: standard]
MPNLLSSFFIYCHLSQLCPSNIYYFKQIVLALSDNIISTPALQGTILPGITRKSIIEVARGRGYKLWPGYPLLQAFRLEGKPTIIGSLTSKVQEHLVSVDELMEADEVFCTGTAVVVSPVGSVTYLGERKTMSVELFPNYWQESLSFFDFCQHRANTEHGQLFSKGMLVPFQIASRSALLQNCNLEQI